MQRELFFDHALLPSGWARDVRITVADGTIVAVAQDAPRGGADHVPGIAVPGLPNLHSHAFQRGMAGLAERRGPTADSFWTWREVMYHFLQRLSPDDVEAIAAFAYMEMLEAGFTTVGEFHYLHHDVDGRPYANLGEMAERIAAASAQTRIGLTLLPSFYAYGGFGGAPPVAGQRRFINDPGSLPRSGPARACNGGKAAGRARGHRAALPARGDARRRYGRFARRRPTGRSISTPPSSCGKWRNASPPSAVARWNGCSRMPRSIPAGA